VLFQILQTRVAHRLGSVTPPWVVVAAGKHGAPASTAAILPFTIRAISFMRAATPALTSAGSVSCTWGAPSDLQALRSRWPSGGTPALAAASTVEVARGPAHAENSTLASFYVVYFDGRLASAFV
jgi:predicted lipoprotein